MTKQHIRRYIWLAVAVFWMFLIFHFSAQKAAESSEVSGTLTYRVAEWASQMFHLDWGANTLVKYSKMLQHPVRKAAHMTEYAILAAIFLGNCSQYPVLKKRRYCVAWLSASVYAATDEFHQLFVEGRSGEFKDVCIDSTGALIGLLAVWAAVRIYSRFCSRSS